jgi:hypothetical protein
MSIPSCEDSCGEDHSNIHFGIGFCPVAFYVPYNDRYILYDYEQARDTDQEIKWPPGSFGFVAGCHWGDDHSWKIQFLDLRGIKEGKLVRDDRFGYIELIGSSDKLKDAFDFGGFDCREASPMFSISCTSQFYLEGEDSEV